MSYSPQQQKRIDNAAKLVASFEGRQLPTGTIQLNKYTKLHDCQRFVEVQIAVIGQAAPLSDPWRAACYRLLDLHEYLNKQDNEATTRQNQ